MEEALLKDMVHERDKKIEQLKLKIQQGDEKMEKLRVELEEVRASATTEKLQRRREIAALVKTRDTGLHNIQRIEKQVRNQSNGSLHLYADVLKEAAPESVDSSYVVRMQSQLCKAMHSMGILEHQLAIVNEISSSVIKNQKDAITTVVDGKSKMELEMMNELVAMDDSKKSLEKECKSSLEKEQLKVVELRRELGIKTSEDENESGSDDESSEEEDEYEMEMREGLEELKEAIAEMYEENQLQVETIQTLKAQIEKLNTVGNDKNTTPVKENGKEDSEGTLETEGDTQSEEY